jgi:hypothetical protein
MSAVDRAHLKTAVLGPIFGGAGAAKSAFGGTPTQVSAANDAGMQGLLVYTAGSWSKPYSEVNVAHGDITEPYLEVPMKYGQGINAQGMPFEEFVAGQMPAGTRLPPNFKTFDFYDPSTGTAVSVKTLDTIVSFSVKQTFQN